MVKKLITVGPDNSLPESIKIPVASIEDAVSAVVTSNPTLKGEDGSNGKSAYQLAVESGYSGSESQWLTALEGSNGLSAYDIAKSGGYSGTEAQWLTSLKGVDGVSGKSAYEIAKAGGYVGTESQWVTSLKGTQGKSAYEVAVTSGFVGTEAQWVASLKGVAGTNAPGSNVLVLSAGNPVPDDTPIGTIIFYVNGDIETPTQNISISAPTFTGSTTSAASMTLTMPSDTSKGTLAILAAQVAGDTWSLPSGWVKVFAGPSNSRAILVAYAPAGVSANVFTAPGGTATRIVGSSFAVTGITGELVGSSKMDSTLDAETSTYKTAVPTAITFTKKGLGFIIYTTNMSTTNTVADGATTGTTQVGSSYTNLHIISKGITSDIPSETVTIAPGMSSNWPVYSIGVA